MAIIMRRIAMAGFIEEICAAPLPAESTSVNYKSISKQAIKQVLPIIIEQDLTERQRICIEKRFYEGKTQHEIADELLLSQPTVSRHIKTAQEVIRNRLYYCNAALERAEKLIISTMN